MNRRIKDLRNALGLTQTAFASQINLSQNFIWLIEKGERIPSDRTLDDICRVYNVNRTWLETGEGEMFLPLDRDKQIADFMKSLFSDDDERVAEIKRGFIAAISKLEPADWLKLAEVARDWIENTDADK